MSALKDLMGQKFGKWTVIERHINPDSRKAEWLCECECGNRKVVGGEFLRNGNSTSCGCNKQPNLAGKKFGEWSVLKYAGKGRWTCQCSCGTIKDILTGSLNQGTSTNCGCKNEYKIDMAGKQFGEWTVIDYAGNSKWNCVCSCGVHKAVLGKTLRNGMSKSCGCRNLNDLTRKQFGYLTVLGRGTQKGKWKVRCVCGTEKEVFHSCLTSGQTKSCGCKSWNDLTGKRFGRLTVIKQVKSYVSPKGIPNIQWLCRCDCGNETIVRSGALTTGHTQSCGCYGIEMGKIATVKHLQSYTRLYRVWAAMKQRCYNPNSSSYNAYGGRGITVCDDWIDDFVPFYEWAMTNGYNPDAPRGECTIDRIDNDKGYSPDNCRWISSEKQANNKQQTVWVEMNGEKKSLKQWCDIYQINYGCVIHRIHSMGWDAIKAITTPSARKRKIS